MKIHNEILPLWVRGLALFAILFGLLTLISGGSVLFNAEARQAAGSYIPFVVWFNFLAGFAYIIAGIGLWQARPWSVWLAGGIAGATLLIFMLFGIYIWSGGDYELRTVGALGLRSGVWIAITAVVYQYLIHSATSKPGSVRS